MRFRKPSAATLFRFSFVVGCFGISCRANSNQEMLASNAENESLNRARSLPSVKFTRAATAQTLSQPRILSATPRSFELNQDIEKQKCYSAANEVRCFTVTRSRCTHRTIENLAEYLSVQLGVESAASIIQTERIVMKTNYIWHPSLSRTSVGSACTDLVPLESSIHISRSSPYDVVPLVLGYKAIVLTKKQFFRFSKPLHDP